MYLEENSLLGSTVANSGDKEKRRALDFYPTPPEVTIALLNFLKLPPMHIWEPACGIGSMSKTLESFGHTVLSTDIQETGYGIGGVDYLALPTHYPVDAIITNPPFNRSEEFIRKAVKEAPLVAMVLKSQYWHAAKRFSLFNDTKPTYILPLTWRPDFLFDQRKAGEKSAPTMDCIWTVWIKGETETKYMPLLKGSK